VWIGHVTGKIVQQLVCNTDHEITLCLTLIYVVVECELIILRLKKKGTQIMAKRKAAV